MTFRSSHPDTPLVTFYSVGKGDCSLIRNRNFTILIDSGEPGYGPGLIEKMRIAGIRRIDWLVVSHAHTDHMGSTEQLADFSFTYKNLVCIIDQPIKEPMDEKSNGPEVYVGR